MSAQASSGETPPGKDARPKRRLPMLNQSPDDGENARPAWHFIVITSVTMLLAWILLAWLVNALLGARVRAGGADLIVTFSNLFAFAASAFGAAALTGRYGDTAGRREARIGGVATAVLGWSVPFGWFALYGEGFGRGVYTWILLLALMIGVALVATTLGFRATRKPTTEIS